MDRKAQLFFVIFIIFFLSISSITTVFVLNSNKVITNPKAATNTDFSVDANINVNPFSNALLGSNFVNWEDSWGKPFISKIPGFETAMKAIHSGIIRYGGGNWSNSMGFDRTLKQITPFTKTTINGNDYYFNYGIDDLADLSQYSIDTKSDVMIEVNIVKNDPQMWADMVRYTNIDHNYHFKYWEIGNELDLNNTLDFNTYSQRLASYTTAMKAVDPTITIITSAPSFPVVQSDTNSVLTDFLTKPLTLTDKLDGLSYHWYQQCNSTNPDDLTRYRFYNSDGTTIDPNSWRNAYSRIWSTLLPNRIKTEIPLLGNKLLAITELNYDACNHDTNPLNSNHLNALWLSDEIGRLAYNGVNIATQFQSYGVQPYAFIYPDNDNSPTSINLRPSYYAYFMYANYFGNQMVQSVSPDDDHLTIWASKDSNDGKLKLMVTNFSSTDYKKNINVSGFNASSASVYEMTSSNPLDITTNSMNQNAGTNINGVMLNGSNLSTSINSIKPINISFNNNVLNYDFKPYSTTSIILNSSNLLMVSPTASPTQTTNVTTPPVITTAIINTPPTNTPVITTEPIVPTSLINTPTPIITRIPENTPIITTVASVITNSITPPQTQCSQTAIVAGCANQTIITSKPIAQGNNINASVVKVENYVQTVKPDSSGNWSVSFTKNLSNGPHILTVYDSSGTVLGSTNFNVNTTLPNTGIEDYLFVPIIISIFLFILSLFVFFKKYPKNLN